jgi:hypothetical protein
MPMARILSEFHYSSLFIEGTAFADSKRLHEELAFKLGLPSWYGRNLDALLECLSSIGEPHGNLCGHWQWQPGKRLVLRIRGFATAEMDANLLVAFAGTVADANRALEEAGASNQIWIEYASARGADS